MTGTTLTEARRALHSCLWQLPVGAKFNVVSFGSTVEWLLPTAASAADTAAVQKALQFACSLDKDLGCEVYYYFFDFFFTLFFSPLSFLFALLSIPSLVIYALSLHSVGTNLELVLRPLLLQAQHCGSPLSIVLFTDAQLANMDSICALLRAHAQDVRLFVMACGDSVWYGSGVLSLFSWKSRFRLLFIYFILFYFIPLSTPSHHAAVTLARASGGAAEFITLSARSRVATMAKRQLSRALLPGATSSLLQCSLLT